MSRIYQLEGEHTKESTPCGEEQGEPERCSKNCEKAQLARPVTLKQDEADEAGMGRGLGPERTCKAV